MRRRALPIAVCLLAAPALAQNGDRKGEVQEALPADLEIPAAPVLSAAEELATFALPPGFEIELVAEEPMVVDPVQVVFDEVGRLWVVEMRGYMPDIEGNGEQEPTGRIAVLTDVDGDGVMDERRDFADGLVLPRGVAPMFGGALCILPPELVFLRDDDGDGVLDRREVVMDGLTKGLENPEHDINSPTVGLDNWVHFANWDRSVRRTEDENGNGVWEIRRERQGGQWGLAQDDVGRFARNTNPQPLFMDITPARYAVRNRHQRRFHGSFAGVNATREVFPARINPGVNRGYQEVTLRDDYTLHYFTAACSATPLRGGALGEDSRGDVFVCEPTGNLIKRYRIDEQPGTAELRANDVRGEHDFLTSTHERFRPVAMTTGPDGALYVADMYRGLIQHRIFLTTFLRRQIEERGLAGPMGLGRIWRIRKEGEPVRRPDVDLAGAGLEELARMLTSENAWVRDSAQRILVEDLDGEAAPLAALRAIVADGDSALGAVHALWTLDGVGYVDDGTLRSALSAADPRVRAAAAEIAERRLDLEGSELIEDVARVALEDTNARARLHGLLALGASDKEEVLEAFALRMSADASSSLERSAVVSGLQFREADFLLDLARRLAWSEDLPGRKELLRSLAACVGREQLQENVGLVVDLALEPPAAWWSKPLLDGLMETRRKGPRGERLPLPLRAMPAYFSAQAADAGAPLPAAAAKVDEGCTWPGKPGAVEIELPRELTAAEVARYEHGREVYENVCATCHQTHGGGQDGKAPTLRGTTYAVGDQERLVRILMHGLEGPLKIEGRVWNMEMPRFEGSDEDLADVLTYVRRSWGNGVEPIALETVARVRAAAGDRVKPMTAAELDD